MSSSLLSTLKIAKLIIPGTETSQSCSSKNFSSPLFPRLGYLTYISPTIPTLTLGTFKIGMFAKDSTIKSKFFDI